MMVIAIVNDSNSRSTRTIEAPPLEVYLLHPKDRPQQDPRRG
jgi:hypothetical protein